MEQEIINNEVITTIAQPLEEFIEQKKQELEMVEMEITQAIVRKENILASLEALIK